MAEQETAPEATELLYTPRPSWGPPIFALGIVLVVVGIYGQGFMVRGWVYMIAGAVIALAALNRVIRSSIRDFYARPQHQRKSTAVLPAGSLRPPGRG